MADYQDQLKISFCNQYYSRMLNAYAKIIHSYLQNYRYISFTDVL